MHNALIPKGLQGSFYTHEQRLQVATIFVTTGSMTAAERQTGIPTQTLSDWRRYPWFIEMVGKVREELEETLTAKTTQIISDALDQITDRIKHGDYVTRETKDGRIVTQRVPIKAKDLAIIAAISVDKRKLLRDNASDRLEASAQQVTDHLDTIAKRLIDLNRTVVGDGKVISTTEIVESST